MILSLGANSAKMCKTEQLKFMVITEWPNGAVAKEYAEKIASIREQISEKFENFIISSHANETFASG